MGDLFAATAAAAVNSIKETSTFVLIADLLTQFMQLLGKSEFIGFGVAIVGLLTLRATMKIGKVEKNTNSLVEKLVAAEKKDSHAEGVADERAEKAEEKAEEDAEEKEKKK